jgi:membrane-associated phospholipid phosphatase
MGAGILVSLFTLARDAVRGHRRRAGSRRAVLAARAVADHVRTGRRPDAALLAGVRPRVSYVLTALTSGGLALYVGIGATANYANPDGFIHGIAWIWAVSLLAALLFGLTAAAAAVAFVAWPRVPRWERPLLLSTPLGQRPPPPGGVAGLPPLLLGWAAGGAVAAAALLVFIAAQAPHVLAPVDEWTARVAQRWTWAEAWLSPFAVFGRTHPAVLLAAGVGLATLRCAPFAMTYLGSVAAGLAVDTAVKAAVSRPRPPHGGLATWIDSFPSGHLIQITLMAGLVPLALLVITRRRWVAITGAVLLSLSVLASAVLRLHVGVHWLSDAVAGVLIGVAIVLVAWWILGDRRRHRGCHSCPWAIRAGRRSGRDVLFRPPPRVEAVVRWGSRAWVLAAVAGFAVLTLAVGLPRNPEGDGLGRAVEQPAQLGLLGLAALAGVLAWRREGLAAVLLVVVGSLLGVFSAVSYQPLVSALVAGVFLVPAAGLWAVWQHRQALRSVAAVAALTGVLVAGTWVGGSAVYGYYYGPAHPASTTAELPVDRVVWAWSGGVTTTAATVVAEVTPGAHRARLAVRPDGGGPEVRTAAAPVAADGVVRLAVRGLAPDTGYGYRIEVDGTPDVGRGFGRFRTMPAGPASFTVAFGSCARTGSSGAVFDAIRATDPLLYVATGDLHYGNPDRADVALFGTLYRRTLAAPAQAALYRSVPVAYVWDDHDYGPNDADATAPTRPAARSAYRRYVPHYPLAGGGAINQAFTVGRVRFILVDTRSERTTGTMLGATQLGWLERELVEAARTHALVVWVNPDPWVAAPAPGADNWGAYPAERRRLADVIANAGIENLIMVSGDAHMVAADDGTHTGYGTAGRRGFPLLHAAALDRPGSVKGGPYSEGAFPGPGQFGTITVTDAGGPLIGVELAGRNWRGETLVSYRRTVAVPPGG